MQKKSFIMGMILTIAMLSSCGGSSSPAVVTSSAETSQGTSEATSEIESSESLPVESSEEESESLEPSEEISESEESESALPSESKESESEEESESAISESETQESSYTTESTSQSDELTITIHYYNNTDDDLLAHWALWLWPKGGDGAEYSFTDLDSFGAYVTIPLSTWGVEDAAGFELGIIVKSKGSWDKKDPDGDRSIVFDELTPVGKAYSIWLKTSDKTIYPSEPIKLSIRSARFTKANRVLVMTSDPINKLELYKDGVLLKDAAINNAKSGKIDLEENGDVMASYMVKAYFVQGDILTSDVDTYLLFDQPEFVNEYAYEGHDLGAVYTAEKTTFKVWAPTSTAVELRIYETGTPVSIDKLHGSDEHQSYKMEKGEKGVFAYELSGDMQGKYYTYVVTNAKNPDGAEVVDPYAKSAGINGLRGMIVDFSRTNPENWDQVSPYEYDRKQLVIYETHVADVTSSVTWGGTPSKAKKFLGMVEKGTHYQEGNADVTTGFDHIVQLGINAVQILPMFDHDNDEVNPEFNWGYNPLNYNCVEGSYSSNAYDGYTRIRELKEVVKEFNRYGINIIMDVVYNHVSNAEASNFEKLVPGYYYRLNNGAYSNGSGCGNETASDRIMFRNFMIDSTEFWAREYKLGGFRFDLMGLHDLDTMEALTANLQKYNEYIVVFGEPWAGGSSTLSSGKAADHANMRKYVGYGAFNDDFRDSLIAGGLAGATETAFADGIPSKKQLSNLMFGIKGGYPTLSYLEPDKNINYVTCHDNYTLYDRFVATGQYEAGVDDEMLERMALLAQTPVMLSQGTSFMLAGEEMLRTKGGNHNSYNASYEVNELDYSLKVQHPFMYSYYQFLAYTKRSIDSLHLDAEAAENFNVEQIDDELVVYEFPIDPATKCRVRLLSAGSEGMQVNTEGEAFVTSTVDQEKVVGGLVNLEPAEVLITTLAA